MLAAVREVVDIFIYRFTLNIPLLSYDIDPNMLHGAMQRGYREVNIMT